MGFQFHRPKLSLESCFTLSLNYGGLCKERSAKQATDNFQRRALENHGNAKFFLRFSLSPSQI